MNDLRKHERFDAYLEVEVTWPGHGTVRVTRDLSDGGVRLDLPFAEVPPVGTVLNVRLATPTGDGQQPPMLQARVAWVAPDGMGLQFVKDAQPA
jgi:hypothetical protein